MDLDFGSGPEGRHELVQVRGCLLLTQDPRDLVPDLFQWLTDLVLLFVVEVADFLVCRRTDLRLNLDLDEFLDGHLPPLRLVLEELGRDCRTERLGAQ